MTYATPNDLKAAIPEGDLRLLTDWDGAADLTNDATLLGALKDATAEVDSYIAKKVSLPLASPPHMLNVVCRDLAFCRLYANVGRMTETQEKLRTAAISYLTKVSEGKVSIGDDGDGIGDPVETSPGVVLSEGDGRTMTRQSLKAY